MYKLTKTHSSVNYFKENRMEKAPSNKTQAHVKTMNTNILVAGTLNQLEEILIL